MKELIKKFFKKEEGTEVVEWAIILSLIVVLSITMITLVGTNVLAAWTALSVAIF